MVSDGRGGGVYNRAEQGEGAVALVEKLDEAQLVHLALARISPPHREILALRFLESMSLDEIAQVLGRRIGTVKSRMHYAKQSFRRAVEELDHG